MCQNNCNDISFLTANTGIATAADANANLIIDVPSNVGFVTVYTAASGPGADGSIIKSIIIKAQQASLLGMVRLFISNGTDAYLYKEVPIPVVPMAATTPVPAPQYIMYETVLVGDFKLSPGFSILATTQNAQDFNVIVEGLDISYPDSPTLCCNLKEEAANTGIGSPAYNTALDGSGNINTIFSAGATLGSGTMGAYIKNITIKALQSVQEGAVRLFISPVGDTKTWTLMQEVYIPLSTQSGFQPSFKQMIAANYNLENGYSIGATTQNNESYAVIIEGEDWIYGN